MIKADRLRAIVECPTIDLRELAATACGDPGSFYRGANFNDADLRGQNLCGFNLDAATFVRTRVDRNTLVDRRYRKRAGLQRLILRVGPRKLINHLLRLAEVQLEKPFDQHLGDLIEEGLHDRSNSRDGHFRVLSGIKELLHIGVGSVLMDHIKTLDFLKIGLEETNSTVNHFRQNAGDLQVRYSDEAFTLIDQKEQIKTSLTPRAHTLLQERSTEKSSLESTASGVLVRRLGKLMRASPRKGNVLS